MGILMIHMISHLRQSGITTDPTGLADLVITVEVIMSDGSTRTDGIRYTSPAGYLDITSDTNLANVMAATDSFNIVVDGQGIKTLVKCACFDHQCPGECEGCSCESGAMNDEPYPVGLRIIKTYNTYDVTISVMEPGNGQFQPAPQFQTDGNATPHKEQVDVPLDVTTSPCGCTKTPTIGEGEHKPPVTPPQIPGDEPETPPDGEDDNPIFIELEKRDANGNVINGGEFDVNVDGAKSFTMTPSTQVYFKDVLTSDEAIRNKLDSINASELFKLPDANLEQRETIKYYIRKLISEEIEKNLSNTEIYKELDEIINANPNIEQEVNDLANQVNSLVDELDTRYPDENGKTGQVYQYWIDEVNSLQEEYNDAYDSWKDADDYASELYNDIWGEYGIVWYCNYYSDLMGNALGEDPPNMTAYYDFSEEYDDYFKLWLDWKPEYDEWSKEADSRNGVAQALGSELQSARTSQYSAEQAYNSKSSQYDSVKAAYDEKLEEFQRYSNAIQDKRNLSTWINNSLKSATNNISKEKIISWLEAGQISSSELQEICSGTWTSAATGKSLTIDEILGSITSIPFKHSALEFYENSNGGVKASELLQIYSGDVTFEVTEITPPDGYVKWANDVKKTIISKYEKGKVTNSKNTSNAYVQSTNDNVEIEHEGKAYGKTDATKLICYDDKDETIFDFTKYSWDGTSESETPASFKFKVTRTEKNLDGSENKKVSNFETSNGKIEIKWSEIGIDVYHRWSGTIEVEIEEVACQGHVKWTRKKIIKWTVTNGVASNVEEIECPDGTDKDDGEDAIEAKAEGGKVVVKGYNTPEGEGHIKIKKHDAGTGADLPGARFQVTVKNETTGKSATADTNGSAEATITAGQLKAIGIDAINRWSGQLTVTIVETQAPQGYVKWDYKKTIKLTCNKGKITINSEDEGDKGEDAIVTKVGDKGICLDVDAYDTKENCEGFKLQKYDASTNNMIQGATFNITVTRSDNGKFISKTISAGESALTAKDYHNLGIDVLEKWSGELAITIDEIQAPGGYITWQHKPKKLTVTYTKGTVKITSEDEVDKAEDAIVPEEAGVTANVKAYDTLKNLPAIELTKLDATSQKPLVGAKFRMIITREGGKTDQFDKTTNASGILQITAEDLTKLGIDVLERWTGKLTVEIRELEAPNGYILWQHRKKISITYNNGKITAEEVSEGDEQEDAISDISVNGYTVTLKAYDTQNNYPAFDLTKLNYLDEKLEGAEFEIKIKREGVGEVILNRRTNSEGKITITAEEIAMPLKIDVLERWTGKLIVTLTEKKAPDGYITWDKTKTITVTYDHGIIQPIDDGETAEGKGEDAIVVEADKDKNASIVVKAYDTPNDEQQIVIQKNDLEGSALRGAVFNIKITSSTGTTVTLNNRRTNDAGQIIIYAEELIPLKIDVLDRWTGTLTVELEEITPPDGYQKIDGTIQIVITYEHGTITKATNNKQDQVEWGIYKSSYSHGNKPRDVGTITVKDRLDNKLRLRKVDGTTSKQTFIEGATFEVSVSKDGRSWKSRRLSTVAQGYIDIKGLAEEAIGGNLSTYSGDLRVKLTETQVPDEYSRIDGTIEVTLHYSNGYLKSAKYADDLSRTVLGVGVSEDETSVTIAVKNTKQELQPIYISKVDRATGLALSNVDFRITVSKEPITGKKAKITTADTTVYKTDDDGLITIDRNTLLDKVGLIDGYTGDVYILINEVDPKAGYDNITGNIYVRVHFENGKLTDTEIIEGEQWASYTISDDKGSKVLKVTIANDKKLPDLVIKKETLTNGHDQLITSATLNVTVTVNGRPISKPTKVDANAEIIFTSDELKNGLDIDGNFSGDITVTIQETGVEAPAVPLPGVITATLKLENGRLTSGTVDNPVHASIIDNGSEIIIKALDTITERKTMILAGTVWEELAWSKADGLIRDGKYTTDSEGEITDKLFEGIEVTLYRKDGNNLNFVNVDRGTNPTFTDAKGHYEFDVEIYENENPEFIVKFTYNGQVFTTSASDEIIPSQNLAEWKLSSKGSEHNGSTEEAGTRNYTDEKLQEIGSYPTNYKVTDNRDSLVFPDKADKFDGGDGSYYNIAYRYEELEDVYESIVEEMESYLATNQYLNSFDARRTVYNNVVANHYMDETGTETDPEIYNKIEYIYDTSVSAYAGYNTSANGINNPLDVKTYPYNGNNLDDYEEQRYINLGLYKRDMTEVHLEKDIASTIVSMNKHDETYTMDQLLSSYEQYLYHDDYAYDTDKNSEGRAWYSDDEVELYVKYKLTLYNTSNTPTDITEIVDYFDNRFELANTYTTSKGDSLYGVEVFKNGGKLDNAIVAKGNSKYPPNSNIGLKNIDDLSAVYLTFANENDSTLNAGDTIEIYLTLRLGKGVNNDANNDDVIIRSNFQGDRKKPSEILQEVLADVKNGVLATNNYVEINGYKAYEKDQNGAIIAKGLLDKVSKPGNTKIQEYQEARAEFDEAAKDRRNNKERYMNALDNLRNVQENDMWAVGLNVRTNLTDDNTEAYRRTLTGSVWKSDNFTQDLLEWVEEHGIKGIIVELVELERDEINEGSDEKAQVVRARTVTDENGNYTFIGYIPGDYTVRFVYGDDANNREDDFTDVQKDTIRETTKNLAGTGINGQYYQSIKANENTDSTKYWYVGDSRRYSDAYDDVNSRLAQIEAQTAGEQIAEGDTARNEDGTTKDEHSWSWNYEVDGIENVQDRTHVDKIDAYTSTMHLEVECATESKEGNLDFSDYRYSVANVDFGLTPRADADMNITKKVKNIKLYTQDGSKQLDADIWEEGGKVQVNYNNSNLYKNAIISTLPNKDMMSNRDGLLEILYDTQLLNGTILEITYEITVSNNGVANTITYFYDNNGNTKPIALGYYKENLHNIVYYESDRDGTVVNHEFLDEKYTERKCDESKTKEIDVRTRATNIVDYIDPSLNFIQQDKEGNAVNGDWELTTIDDFKSSRENYTSTSTGVNIMNKYNTIIRAKGGATHETYLDYLNWYNDENKGKLNDGLYSPLTTDPTSSEHSVSTELVLSRVLETTSTQTNDYEYSNLMEITKLENYAGKSIKLKAYDPEGNEVDGYSECSQEAESTDVETQGLLPTVGTAKSETISIHEPTGLTQREEAQSNLWIVLVVLVILATGIVLIKKFVLTPKEMQ